MSHHPDRSPDRDPRRPVRQGLRLACLGLASALFVYPVASLAVGQAGIADSIASMAAALAHQPIRVVHEEAQSGQQPSMVHAPATATIVMHEGQGSMDIANEWLTTDQLASIEGVNQDTIRRWIAEGKVEAEKQGSTWRIRSPFRALPE